jgi:SET domain-containing protein
MTKDELIHELQYETYVTLKPSAIDGIGVFAIRDIPKGCRNMFAIEPGEWIKVPKPEVASLPEHARQLVENFCLWDEDHYFIPGHGLKVMDLTSYLNHSDQPNIISINDGEAFEATVSINKGEELFIDYGTIVNDADI